MIGRLLCALGFHAYRNTEVWPGFYDMVCRRCFERESDSWGVG